MKNKIFILVILSLISFSTGCASYVFNKPTTLSTKSEVVKHVKLLKEVKAEYTNIWVIIIPIMPDPRKVYDNLLEEAKKAGGNAVVDVQIRPKKSGMKGCIPLFISVTFEAVGTAAIIE
jgi:hypothetical protein